jgi:hypothetical protein
VQAKAEKIMYDFNVLATVAVPLLSFSSRSLQFEYHYHPIIEQAPKQQSVTITNVSKLPLSATLRTAAPFTMSTRAIALAPGAAKVVTITMNHDFRKDLISQKPKYAPNWQ